MSSSIESSSGVEPVSPGAARWLTLSRWADRLSLACFGVLALVLLYTVPDYGLTYDEEPHVRLGERVLRFYTEGFGSSGSLNRSAYGAGFDLAAALLRRVSPWDEFRTNHVLCVFVAQLGLLGTWRLGRLLAGPLGGLLSLVFLTLNPVYYGHQFNNPKDIPFAVGYVWGAYAVARILLCAQARAAAPAPLEPAAPHGRAFLARVLQRRSELTRWLAVSVIFGLAMSVRIAGVILIAYLFAFLTLVLLDAWRLGHARALPAVGGVALSAALAALGSWAVMLVFWPGALLRPVEKPTSVLETLTRFTPYDSPTLLHGAHVSSNRVPWDYLPSYFLRQLPELTSLGLVAALLGLCVHSLRCLRGRRPLPWAWWLLVGAVLVPPGYAILRHSVLYNGLRHFLFLMPLISVLAAGAAAQGVRLLLQRDRRWLALPALLLAAFSLDQVRELWRLHPYQHVYFNRAAGGVARAIDRYETEYYGSVYQELHAELIEQVWAERRDVYLDRTFQVAGCGSKLFFTRNLPLNFQYQSMRDAGGADFFASYVRDDCLRRFRDRRQLLEVAREGATLALARDLKSKNARSSGGERP